MDPYSLVRRILDAGLVPAIVGPTASGKTACAIRLAAHFGGALEVVSADAFQVYRGMEIGTAKPTRAEREAVRHHLVDICDPGDSYAAGRFMQEAARALDDIKERGRIPLVVGGSGLYLSALLYGLHAAQGPDAGADAGVDSSADPVAVPDAEQDARAMDRNSLLQALVALDPAAAAALVAAPRPRILRAVELVREAGRPLAEIRQGRRQVSAHRFRIIRLVTDRRGVLYPRINERAREMFARGLVEEVEGLRRAGIGRDAPSQRAIGYREAHRVLDGELTSAEAIALTQRNTRRYAKRQETWFRTQFPGDDVVTLAVD